MPNLFRRVFRVLAESSQHHFRRQVQFLKAENEILRSRIKGAVRTTPRERARLVRLGMPLGAAVKSLITIVSPETFCRWLRGKSETRRNPTPRKPGRPRTPESIRELVLRLATETDWGYTRIHSELKKLGITISRRGVADILRDAGIPTGPERGEGTWDEFIKAHAKTLWACDFTAKKALTWRGWVDVYLLVFIHIQSRRVWIAPATQNPNGMWVANATISFMEAAARQGLQPRMLARDRDSKFGPEFDRALEEFGVKQTRLPHRSPNLNAHVERFIKTLKVECLDRFIVMGIKHLDHLIAEFTDYYNRQRPHSGIDGATPIQRSRAGPTSPEPLELRSRDGPVCCRRRLGGVVKHYYRPAA